MQRYAFPVQPYAIDISGVFDVHTYIIYLQGEADHIAEWGGTFVDEFDIEAFKDPKAQTGLGKYLTPSPGEWPGNLVPNPR